MFRTFLISSFLVFLFPARLSTPIGRIETASAPEPVTGSVVCPPASNKGIPVDCLPLGPSEYVAQSIAQGIPFPFVPLPAYPPDRSLADSPYHYFKVIDTGAVLYATLDAARSHVSSKILYPSNHLYVSYLGEAVQAGKDYYYPLRSGNWVFADGGRLGRYDPPFQGLQFSSTPRMAFGWILGQVQSRSSPGMDAPQTGLTRYRFQVIQIYATKKVDDVDWVLVGPGEWIDSRQIARANTSTLPPAGVTGDRWIAVNLFEQTLTVFDHDSLVFATMVSTGVDRFWTRPGLFQIKSKLETETMSNSVQDDFYYLEDVPWTMYFDEARALHGAYWHQNFGYQQSHGCVNLSVGDAHWLFNWASEGDFVYVYDPSGQTPTDPALFGTGAP